MARSGVLLFCGEREMIQSKTNVSHPKEMAKKRALRGQGRDFSPAVGIAKGGIIPTVEQKTNYTIDFIKFYQYNLTVEVEMDKIKNNSCSLVCRNRKVRQVVSTSTIPAGAFFLSKGERHENFKEIALWKHGAV
jgi:hypothetical protein